MPDRDAEQPQREGGADREEDQDAVGALSLCVDVDGGVNVGVCMNLSALQSHDTYRRQRDAHLALRRLLHVHCGWLLPLELPFQLIQRVQLLRLFVVPVPLLHKPRSRAPPPPPAAACCCVPCGGRQWREREREGLKLLREGDGQAQCGAAGEEEAPRQRGCDQQHEEQEQ